MSRKQSFVLIIVFLLLISLPVIIASQPASDGSVFNGFLANPADGHSYLAKIEQGRAGAWGYRLAFNVEDTQPHFLFFYYLLLGHLCRLFSIPAIWMFHLARIVNSLLLAITLRWFIHKNWNGSNLTSDWVWAITLLGSGMGWVLIWTGHTPADFWIAEAYPLLSGFTNPHFPLSISILMLGLLAWDSGSFKKRMLGLVLSGLFLAVIQPFAAVILGCLIGFDWLWHWHDRKYILDRIGILLAYAVSALPIMILYQVDVARDPFLQSWNAQNLTPSPPWWDLLLSFSPAILLVGLTLYQAIKHKDGRRHVFWFWLLIGFGICVLPIQLQRRFLIGIYIPVTILAADGLEILGQTISQTGFQKVRSLYVGAIIPTTLVLLIIYGFGIISHHPDYYLSAGEASALNWLHDQQTPGKVVLTEPKLGMYIPGWTGMKVFYGHPYETPEAEANRLAVENCMSTWQPSNCDPLFMRVRVSYVLVSDLTRPPDDFIETHHLKKILSQQKVVLYEFEQ